MCLLRRDTWVPPYKSFCRGRCPHRPAAIGAAPPRCKAPSGRGLSAQPTGGEEMPPFASPSVSASRCHLSRRGRQGENGLPRRFAPRNDSASRRRGRRPAVERSGTNALGVRRPVCRGGRLCPPCTLRSSRRSEALQHKKRTARGRFFFCLFRADRSGIRCRYQSRPGCSNSLSASQTQPRSHLPAD